MKSFKKTLGLLLAATIITSMLAVPALADGILSVSNAGGGAAYGNSERYFFDMSYELGKKLADNTYTLGNKSISSPLSATWEAADPIDGSNKVVKIDTTNASSAYGQIKFRNENISPAEYAGTGPQIIGFDFLISGAEVADDVTAPSEFFLLNAFGTQRWAGGGSQILSIQKDGDNTVIKAYNGLAHPNDPGSADKNDPNGRVIEQDKWYTCYIYTDFNYDRGEKDTPNFATQLYISEKGKKFDEAWHVSTQYSNMTNTHQPHSAYFLTYGNRTKNGFTYYIDNLYIDSVVSVDATELYLAKGDTAQVDFYVAPGFDSATVSVLGEEAIIEDNGTGYYTLGINVPENAELGADDVTVNAVYPKAHLYHSNGKTMTATGKVCVTTAPSYTYALRSAEPYDEPFFFDFNDGNVNSPIQAKKQADTKPGTVTRSSDAGYDFVKDENDKSLKVTLSGDTGAFLLGDYGHSYPKAINASNTAKVRFKADLKFDSDSFGLSFQNRNSANTWVANYTLVDVGGKVFKNSSVPFEANNWYRFEFVYDLISGTITTKVNGNEIIEKQTGKNLDNITVTQFAISPSTSEGNKTIWIDNLSKEYEVKYYGIKNYNPVVENNSAFTAELEKPLYFGPYTAELLYSDETEAGTASFTTDADTNLTTGITVTPNTTFDTKKDITLVIKNGNEVIEKKTYVLADAEGTAISEISLTQDSEKVYANVKATSAETAGTLYLVGYTADYRRLTNVSVKDIPASATFEDFGTFITKKADDVIYRAFIWSPEYEPIETAVTQPKN